MLRNTAIGLRRAFAVSGRAGPGARRHSGCMKQPNADTCPTMGAPTNVPAQGTH